MLVARRLLRKTSWQRKKSLASGPDAPWRVANLCADLHPERTSGWRGADDEGEQRSCQVSVGGVLPVRAMCA